MGGSDHCAMPKLLVDVDANALVANLKNPLVNAS
jgi:hypothetical protein